MKFKQILTGVLALVMLAGSGAGCTQKTSGPSDKVVLKYVMPAPGKQEDSEKVWAAFNTKLQEKLPNVEVQFEVIPLSEYKQKFALMCASKEQIDIANNYGLDFSVEVENGTFEPLDALLEQYGAETKAALPEWFMDYQKVNGQIYGIPTYQMCANIRSLCFIKEYAEQYLDIAGLTNELNQNSMFTEKAFDILGDFAKKVKEAGIPFKSVAMPNIKGMETVVSHYSVDIGDDSCQVFNTYANDYMKNTYFKRAREWFQAGYIRQDVVGANDMNNFIGKKDGYLWWDAVWTPFVEENLTSKYGVEILTIPYADTYFIGKDNTAGGTSIMASSKHKEEAMQVINLLQSDKELYNLLVFGIEGEHYTKVGEDRIETVSPTGQATANDKYGLYKWIVGNTELAYDHQLEPEGYKHWVFDEVNSSENRSKLMGFVPDTSSISNYIAQVESIRDEYYGMLMSGAMENWEEMYAEWQNKLELAGNGKIIAEIQKQVDAFLAEKA